jgi:predicted enzyme related to lactoylglutathione lyase
MDDIPLRTKYRPGVPCWVDTSQPDVDAAVAFYGGLFGWEYEERPVPGAGDRYLIARCDGEVVGGLGRAAAEDPDRARWTTYVAVSSADEAADLVRANGGQVRFGPVDAGPAGRSAICVDPAGAELGIWQQGRRLGVERCNVPVSWAWNDLLTSDPATVSPFYAAVFGWEARRVRLGDAGEGMIWTVPGYGDALAELDPTMRERHAEDHVPEGFADAIGGIGEPDGGPPRWQVMIAVDDPDAVAARARELGGEVRREPNDAGVLRTTLLADPAGATFVAGRYEG